MPLDGEEHACAEDEHLERYEDYRDPIDHFENFQPMTDTVCCEEHTSRAREAKTSTIAIQE